MSRHHRKAIKAIQTEADEHRKNGVSLTMVAVVVFVAVALVVFRMLAD